MLNQIKLGTVTHLQLQIHLECLLKTTMGSLALGVKYRQ